MVHWWWTMLARGYEAACRDWAAFAEKVCEGLSDERLARCREIFHACSAHELKLLGHGSFSAQ